MRLSEFYLLKLAEECMEVGQRVSKSIQFSDIEVQENEHQNPLKLNNRERLQAEVNDVLAMIVINGLMPSVHEIASAALGKRMKLNKYLNLSRECGCIDDDS